MARLKYNGLKGTLGGSLTSSATSVTFGAALTHSNGTSVPTISGTDYIPLTILDSSGNLSEIVWLTAYTSGATTGTIGRGKESTTGVSHASGDKFVQGPTEFDLSFHGAKVKKSATQQTFPNATVAALTWQTEEWDTDNYWTSGASTRMTVGAGMGGKYLCVAHFTFDAGASYDTLVSFAVNGTELIHTRSRGNFQFAHLATSTVLSLADGDYVETMGYQASGSSKDTPATANFSEFSIHKVS